jgi:hypothetical protein
MWRSAGGSGKISWLVISAIVPREDLFVGFDAAVDTHNGNEEIAIDDNNLGRERVVFRQQLQFFFNYTDSY